MMLFRYLKCAMITCLRWVSVLLVACCHCSVLCWMRYQLDVEVFLSLDMPPMCFQAAPNRNAWSRPWISVYDYFLA